MQGTDDSVGALKVRIGNPHGQNIFIKTIPLDAFRMTAVNYAIKVHWFLLSAILNPSPGKWLRLLPSVPEDFLAGLLWYTLRVKKTLQSIYNLMGYADYLTATLAATLLGGATGGEGSLPRLGIAVLSNFLLFSLAVIYQKIKNAPIAATEPNCETRNPIAAG
jgi:hypothetical protein